MSQPLPGPWGLCCVLPGRLDQDTGTPPPPPMWRIFLPAAVKARRPPASALPPPVHQASGSQEGCSLGDVSVRASSPAHAREVCCEDADHGSPRPFQSHSEVITTDPKLPGLGCSWDPGAAPLGLAPARLGAATGSLPRPAALRVPSQLVEARLVSEGRSERRRSKSRAVGPAAPVLDGTQDANAPKPAGCHLTTPRGPAEGGLLPVRGSGHLEGRLIFEKQANKHPDNVKVSTLQCLSLNYIRSLKFRGAWVA